MPDLQEKIKTAVAKEKSIITLVNWQEKSIKISPVFCADLLSKLVAKQSN